MLSTINLVVHLETLQDHADEGDNVAKIVLTKINDILISEQSFRIDDNPFNLPQDLPLPSSNIKIRIVGAYYRQCCIKTLYSARKAGYQAEINSSLCFDNGFKMPKAYQPEDLHIIVPEYIQM